MRLLPGPMVALSLALICITIVITGCSENIALGRPAYQSSTWRVRTVGFAGLAVDGNNETDFYRGSCSHTLGLESWWPWWSVDLQWRRTVSNVTLTNRQHKKTYKRLRTVHIGLTDVSPLKITPALTNFAECAYVEGPVGRGATESFSCHNGGVMGRFLIVQLEHNEALQLCEVQVYENRRRMSFTAQLDHALSGHVISTQPVCSEDVCSVLCVQDYTCSSFNYHAVSGSCELNNATYDEEQSDVIVTAGWSWYNRRV